MAVIRPFNAMLYKIDRNEDLEQLCCPPYDIISPELQDRLYALPHNAIHLELPRGDGEQRYKNAAKTLENWLASGARRAAAAVSRIPSRGSRDLWLSIEAFPDRKSTRLNSSHTDSSRMPSSA